MKKKKRLGRRAAAIAALILALAAATPTRAATPQGEYRSKYVAASGANREAIERECDAIVERLAALYGRPKRWRAFPVKIEPREGGSIAGYTLYRAPNVLEVVSYRSLEESRGGVLDHEMTHAFFFYLIGSSFDLFLNEGLAQSSEYANRANLREIAWRRYTSGEFLPLASLYGRGEYDKGLLLYTEGFSVVDFLIGRGGSRWFAEFVKYLTNESQGVGEALRAFYGYASLGELQEDWLRYVETGQDRSRTRRVYFRYDEEKKE